MPRLFALFVVLLLTAPVHAQQAMTFEDVMRFRDLHDPVIAADGSWIAYGVAPDRGDGEAVVQAVDADTRYVIAQASDPQLTPDGAWAALRFNPTMAALEEAPSKAKPQPGLVLLETATGAETRLDSIRAFAFSDDGRWLAMHHIAPEDTAISTDRDLGAPMTLRELATGRTITVDHVRTFAFSPDGAHVAYTIAHIDSSEDGLFLRTLADADAILTLDARPRGHYGAMAWSDDDEAPRLAFLAATEDAEGEPGPAMLHLWDGDTSTLVEEAPEGWMIPAHNTVTWSRDGGRLFFGYRPMEPDEAAEDTTAAFNPYDEDALLDDSTVDVWHWNDPRIKTHEKRVWAQDKDRTWRAVHHLDDALTVQLETGSLRLRSTPEDDDYALAEDAAPYLREQTWDGFYDDLYVIDMRTGAPTQVATRTAGPASLDDDGDYVIFYQDEHWHLVDVEAGTTRTLTEGLGVPFANEDHDYPQPAPGYGLGGWVGEDEGVLIYDKFDIWYVPTDPDGEVLNWTEGQGRATNRTFRVVRTDPDQRGMEMGDEVLLEVYHNHEKTDAYHRAVVGETGTTALLEVEARLGFVAKADDTDRVLYTRERYDEFPDLWVTTMDFESPRKLTEVNPQMADFNWGSAELIEWRNLDGRPMQGVVIKPSDYDPAKRYPVMVYFYRFFSQRLHQFNQPVVNHRPSFPLYVSNGYVVFLPDIRFEVEQPGLSATKSLVPGVQQLIDLGIADPDAIGLHGHSWSGYQTAHIVTQTDIFAAAVTGAPVSNMTSAYSGIRWGSGLARQFQYEQSQSRIGGSLWERRDAYIENSPVFFVDRMNTPLLIMHGDDDGAVPWYQSIELYLACRRLQKDCIFLQYGGEDHHLHQYPNKLDYAQRMMQYFDHYLKGTPAPSWITTGVPYEGD
ncbi:MAG: prolyl oligopeptidase family serine peptidase [Bacteroidota bacterium]